MKVGGSKQELKLQRTLRGDKDVRISSCVIVPGRPQVATGLQDGALLLWPLDPGRPRPLRLGGQQGGPITHIAASPSGELLATAAVDATVAVWQNRAGRQSPNVMKVHFNPVRSCDFSGDERFLLTASDDKSVKLCSLADRRFLAAFTGHSNWVRSAVFSPSSCLVASGGDDKTVRLWDVERRASLRVWHECAGAVTCARFGPAESILAASSWDSAINLWDTRSHALRQHYGRSHGSSPVTQVAFHPVQDLLLSSSADRTLRLWDLRAGRLRSTIEGHELPVQGCCWNADGSQFASFDSQLVHLWDFEAGPPTEVPLDLAVDCVQEAEQTTVETAEGSRQEDTLDPQEAGAPPFEEVAPKRLATACGFRPPLRVASAAAGRPPQPKSTAPPPLAPKGSRGSAEPACPMTDATCELVARSMEQLVSQMDILTQTLQGLESRLARTEAISAEVAGLLRERRQAAAGESSGPQV